MRFSIITLFFATLVLKTSAQVTGGESAFQFLRLSQHAQITAMGGLCVSNPENNVALSIANPALLKPWMHQQLSISNNFYIAGTNVTNATYAWRSKKLKSVLACGATSVVYGKQSKTDIYGNILGDARAQDAVVYFTASRPYKQKWQVGSTLKLAQSQLVVGVAQAILLDGGVHYADTSKQFYFGTVFKNLGAQVRKYSAQAVNEPLPFDLQIGITKKLLKAPVRFSIMAHHLNRWDIRYDNPADRNDNFFVGTDSTSKSKSYFADKFFRHFNANVDLLLGKRFTASFGYSHLRRNELALSQKKGSSGFSFGLAARIYKMHVYYARSMYHLSGAHNEISINLPLNETFGWQRK